MRCSKICNVILCLIVLGLRTTASARGCHHDEAVLEEIAQKAHNQTIELLDDTGTNQYGRKLSHQEAELELAQHGRHRGLHLHYQRRLTDADVDGIRSLEWKPLRLSWQAVDWSSEQISSNQQAVLMGVMDEAVAILGQALQVCVVAAMRLTLRVALSAGIIAA